uniref:bifunctional DNA primase/polymerase n=1 Tax=Prosthecobacter sp. TaxID=1965333 RepID=UPI003782E72D
MKPDWPKIRAHYEQTGESLRAVAERFAVSISTLFKKAARDKWKQNGGVASFGVEANGSRQEANGSKALSASISDGSRQEANRSKTVSASISSGSKVEANGSKYPFASILASTVGGSFQIPAAINDWDRLTASRYYLEELGWAVHQLYPPDKGDDKERGKKPACKGWRDHKASDVTTADLAKVFGPHTSNNLGVVVRPPFVAVDLDSKADSGDSVRAWLAEHSRLADVPRERTGGGAHLHFICRDLPLHLLKSRKPPTVQINAKVSAELYLNGFNLVVAPSIHRTGHRYTWEVTGPIPEVRWADLNTVFGFEHPASKSESTTPGKKDKTWWTAFKGDLATLNILALFRSADRLGDCLDPDQSKWAVRCPWEHEHSGDLKGEAGSDTVIFSGRPPGFKCLHAHCAERGMEQVCAWFENTHPGAIDDHCQQLRGTFAQET